MRKIVFITGKNGFFGQTRKPWVSMDSSKIHSIFQSSGFEVEQYTLSELFDKDIKGTFIFYSFSQKEEQRAYLNDIIYSLKKTNILIPSYDLLKCHENKGYQELLKKRLGIISLKSYYFNSSEKIVDFPVEFPIVLKTVDGSNGKGVFLIKNKDELHKIIRKTEPNISLLQKVDLFRRKFLRKKKTYPEYPDYNNKIDYYQYKDYIQPNKRFILQQYIPNLTYDFRVLILFDKFFVTKRYNRKNDFRASGAKKFDFNFPPEYSLLDYAEEIHEKIDSPYLSIDIAYDGKQYYMLEFQALHFGINVFVKNSIYFKKEDKNWKSYPIENNFETEMALALLKYLQSLNLKK